MYLFADSVFSFYSYMDFLLNAIGLCKFPTCLIQVFKFLEVFDNVDQIINSSFLRF